MNVPVRFNGVALGLGYAIANALVVGALFASHTLIGMPIVMGLGATQVEPVVVAVGSTMLSDALALVGLAACVSTFVGGFSWAHLARQMAGIAVVALLMLLGIGWAGARVGADRFGSDGFGGGDWFGGVRFAGGGFGRRFGGGGFGGFRGGGGFRR